MSAAELQIGTVLDRRYRLDRLLGVGGAGAVYAAWHLNLERPVAIKVLHPQVAAHPERVERFRLEAQVMGMIGHDSVVSVIDFRYASAGPPYMVMELVDGETLRARLARGPLSVEEVGALLPPLCEALEQAHERGIVHGDLKPDNLMLTTGEQGPLLKILDFGTCRLGGAGPVEAEPAGTPHYLAPERFSPGSRPDPRWDLFALGAVLYECLQGARAFEGEAPLQVAYRIREEPVPPLQLAEGSRAAALDEVIRRACEKAPAARFQSARGLAEALRAAIERGRGLSGSFWAAVARPQGEDAGPLPPLVPRLLSAGPGLSAGVKPAVLHAVLQKVGEAGQGEALAARLGAEWFRRLGELVLTDWVDGIELQRLLGLAGELLGGEPAQRQLGRDFADAALGTVYKSLLQPGEPEHVVRRTQVMLRLWHSEGESQSTELSPGDWRLRISGLRTMDEGVAAGTAGFIERYLELAGAAAARVVYGRRDEPAGLVWEFAVQFLPPG